MGLNSMKPADGAKHAQRRVGRGIGSGLGKTAGLVTRARRRARAAIHKVGFEGGQMPLHRRLPKRGLRFACTRNATAEVRLSDLQAIEATDIDLPR